MEQPNDPIQFLLETIQDDPYEVPGPEGAEGEAA
jgi:hypothetical protein